jgi:hypothetical protein
MHPVLIFDVTSPAANQDQLAAFSDSRALTNTLQVVLRPELSRVGRAFS